MSKKPKYNNKKVTWNGRKFDSIKEAKRAFVLFHEEKQGLISDLKYQVRFKLIVNDVLICTYIADFTYVRNGKYIVEDVKGYKTDVYKLKKSMMKAILDINIYET